MRQEFVDPGPEFSDRPYSARRGFEPMTLVGLLFTVCVHGGVVGAVVYLKRASASAPPPAEEYVVARLVRLGKKRNPKHLPKKVVPTPPTVKQETVSYNAEADDAPVKKKHKDKPKHAVVSDRMQHSLDKAALLERADEEIEAEGDPEGVAGGTAATAEAGDPYLTRIADLWRRTWTLPAIIPREEASKLQVLMVLHIDETGAIIFPIEFDRSSGNEHFDNSIKAAWRRIRRLPMPPPDRLASMLANGLALKLTWKGLQ